MKKAEVTKETANAIVEDYVIDLIGTPTLEKKYKLSKRRILEVLKDNGVEVGQPGRRNLGGKSASDKRHYQKNKEKRSAYFKEWGKENAEHRKEYYKKWREENPEKWRESKRNYERKRKKADGVYKLVANFRTALYTALKEQNAKRYESYFRTLGYTQAQLADHLESLFTEGMSWENYGEWHVDHIKPMKKFTFTSTSDPQFRECWSLANLQPLWGPENLSKGCK